jgi:hypothetical protein
MKPRQIALASAIMLITALAASTAPADEAAAPSGSLEFDAKVELGLHQRLIATRTRPGAALAPFSTDCCSGGMSAGRALTTASFPQIAKQRF